MPTWLYGTDRRSAPESEREFAKAIHHLPRSFTVLWRYYYRDSQRGDLVREGDFIIQGPDGHLLVVECKTSGLSFNKSSYQENGKSIDDPTEQLFAQRRWVLVQAKERFGNHSPFISGVIFLPQLIAPLGDVQAIHGIPREYLIGLQESKGFPVWWQEYFKRRKPTRATGLLQAIAPQAGVKANDRTGQWVKEELARISSAKFHFLDSLKENPRLFVQGGPGTGKTWMAIRTARRWADSGKRVLFLCFNLELESRLRGFLPDKRIEVHSFESLARKLLGTLHVPEDPEAVASYWWETVPLKLLEHVTSPRFKAQHDALVVDEAQDHDTSFAPTVGLHDHQAGWWSIYFNLLKEGSQANVAVFFDPFQRMIGRLGTFEPSVLGNALQNPVRLHLEQPVRYTRQIREYLSRLVSPSTRNLAASMASSPLLPEGAEVQIIKVSSSSQEREAVQKLLHDWSRDEYLRPEDFLVLFRSVSKTPRWATADRLGPFHIHREKTVVSGKIHMTSIKKARGLEEKAVILTGLNSWAKIKADDELAHLYFTGASRAREYLAIIERTQDF